MFSHKFFPYQIGRAIRNMVSTILGMSFVAFITDGGFSAVELSEVFFLAPCFFMLGWVFRTDDVNDQVNDIVTAKVTPAEIENRPDAAL